MSGLGNLEMRQAMWEKHYWKGADEEQDQKLMFDEVEKLCRRLNINSSPSELRRLFKVRYAHSLCDHLLISWNTSKPTSINVIISTSRISAASSNSSKDAPR